MYAGFRCIQCLMSLCCCSGIPVLSVGGLGCVVSVGVESGAEELPASGEGRVRGTTEY